MSMPRPSGKALKIAKDTVPGLSSRSKPSKRKNIQKDNIETKNNKINENMGRNLWK